MPWRLSLSKFRSRHRACSPSTHFRVHPLVAASQRCAPLIGTTSLGQLPVRSCHSLLVPPLTSRSVVDFVVCCVGSWFTMGQHISVAGQNASPRNQFLSYFFVRHFQNAMVQLPQLPADIWSYILELRSNMMYQDMEDRYQEMEDRYLAKACALM